MCGIAGWFDITARRLDAESGTLEHMLGAIRHRGPDEFGVFRSDGVGLASARLAIIDVASGQQPMHDGRESSWLVFNGEIFNHVELREELVRAGCRFRTTSDTEVILQAYSTWGSDAFDRFNGQFAIALWDGPREALILARDRLGVRPLYVCERDGRMWFASEVRAIFAADPSIPRALDPVGLVETFTFWSPVAPQTAFVGISELEPGHLRVVTRTGVTDRAYWAPRYPDPAWPGYRGSLDDAAHDVKELLTDAVRLRMTRSDVPVGSYLSGGLDSALLVALARPESAGSFSTFSIRFKEPEFDESEFQRAMVRRLDTDHHELLIGRADIAAVFPDVVRHAERPLLRTAAAPMFLLSAAVQDAGIKVVLTGEGADEMFGGYDLFREARIRRFWARDPTSRLRPRLLSRLYPYVARSPVRQAAMAQRFFGQDLAASGTPGFGHQLRWRGAAPLLRLLTPDVRAAAASVDVVGRLLGRLPAPFERWPSLAQDQYLEIRSMMSGYLLAAQGDRMLMAHSVEGRFPFLDHRVVALADSLPSSFKLRGLDEKHLLKRVAVGLVPDEIIRRPKQPYRAPDAASFLGENAPSWVADALDPGAIGKMGVFDQVAVQRLVDKVRSTADPLALANSDNMAFVAVLSTVLLHDHLIRDRAEHRRLPALRTAVDLRHGRSDGPDRHHQQWEPA